MTKERDWLNTLFGHHPGEYDGDADKFLASCHLVDDEVREAIATIMRKCPCAVVFGDEEHPIDAKAGGCVNGVGCYIGGKRKIDIQI